MPRKLRVEYPAAIYEVMNRGDRREPIFQGDPDRDLFLSTFGQCCGKTGREVHAYCSCPPYLQAPSKCPSCSRVDRVLDEHGWNDDAQVGGGRAAHGSVDAYIQPAGSRPAEAQEMTDEK